MAVLNLNSLIHTLSLSCRYSFWHLKLLWRCHGGDQNSSDQHCTSNSRKSPFPQVRVPRSTQEIPRSWDQELFSQVAFTLRNQRCPRPLSCSWRKCLCQVAHFGIYIWTPHLPGCSISQLLPVPHSAWPSSGALRLYFLLPQFLKAARDMAVPGSLDSEGRERRK